MTVKEFLLQTFTWWNGQTLGTRFHTWRKGRFVGADEFGNRYYQAVGPLIDPSIGTRKRWVTYSGEADASKVPPGWAGWLRYTTDVPPSEETYSPRSWEKPHLANRTGTAEAYRPRGSLQASGQRPAATGDYVAWSPKE